VLAAGGVDVPVADEERVRLHRVHLDRYAICPGGAELRDRDAGVDQQRPLRPLSCLRQALRRHHAEREAGVDQGGRQLLGRPDIALDQRSEPDPTGVAHPFLQGGEGATVVQVWRVNGVAGAA
jgi:hypothetical protein